MRASSLEHATALQNATDFGLTAGLHSLDPAEISWWRDHALAGNLYINRPITGAIVQRQPFGGWKKSCVGPGPKAGGPNYVLAFASLSDINPDSPDNYSDAWASHFALEHDPSNLRAESNIFHAAHSLGLNWIHAPLLASGRIELTRWLREQSISSTIHRYGQLPNHLPTP